MTTFQWTGDKVPVERSLRSELISTLQSRIQHPDKAQLAIVITPAEAMSIVEELMRTPR